MPPGSSPRIRHAVVFRLAHPQASEGEAEFLRAVRELEAIDGVEAFELAREVSPKNPFTFALAMEFADQQAYDAYNGHPRTSGSSPSAGSARWRTSSRSTRSRSPRPRWARHPAR
jgi:quinol monooxygenase YgiN